MSFPFDLVSPERLVFSGDVDSVVVPGMEGEFTVLKDHAPLMSMLKPGVVAIAGGPAGTTRMYVRGGFADVAPSGLTILADYAVAIEDLDPGALDADIAQAASDLAAAVGDETRRVAAERRDQLSELKTALARG